MPSIQPTSEEEQLFQLILNAANHKQLQDISIRVAGGWVRDKLLLQHDGYEPMNDSSNQTFVDIDIALGGMLGVDFATHVKEYMDLLQKDGKMANAKHKIGVISANPDQSKHLETATMNILGMDIDFVNLRAEEIYTDNSRIPSSTNPFGTPLQDAMRRDFTINALFYNLRTRQVEDYTQRGIVDLYTTRQIQTPIDPNQTFLDDPLRVLRAIRFGIRYGFELSQEVRLAAMSEKIQLALQQKVSRERVGKELEGMLSGKLASPSKALQLIASLNLSESVFSVPNVNNDIHSGNYRLEMPGRDSHQHQEPTLVSPEFWITQWKYSQQTLHMLSSHVISSFQQLIESLNTKNNANQNPNNYKSITINQRMLHLSTFLLPFFPINVVDRKGKELSLPQWMLKDGIKFKNMDVQTMGIFGRNLSNVIALIQSYLKSPTEALSRLDFGLLLRNLKAEWLTAFILATVSIVHTSVRNMESPTTSTASIHNSCISKIVQASVHVCEQIIYELNLNECWKMRPILDGKKVIQRLALPKGPIVGVYLEEQVKFMLQHPNSTKEECEEFLLQTREKRQLDGLDDAAIPVKQKK